MYKKGQVALEPVVLFIVFLLAFVCMRDYLRGGIQSHWRSNIDSFSDEQYERGTSQERGIGNPAGTLVFVNTTITSNLTGSANLLDAGGSVKPLPRRGNTGPW
jgi:hypothetical protein